MTTINELDELEDITDSLVFEDEPSIFCEEHTIQLVETAFHLMEEFMNENPSIISEPNFHEILLEEVKEMFYVQMEDHILDSDYIEEDMNDILEDAFNIYITTFHTERSLYHKNDENVKLENTENKTENKENIEIIEKLYNNNDMILQLENKIQKLRDIPQPVQRTKEWYEFRWNLITASNAYKAFESQSMINQLIYEKCQPIKSFEDNNDSEDVKMVNTNTTLHWGQKYEPLSVMIYEYKYKTKIEDFGCIQHPTYKFIGASPDGINVDKNSSNFGRMLEIKNIVNREINGIPKKEYWVQMQLQMEVCDLDMCDFLETKFIEYPNKEAYLEDTTDCNLMDKECPFMEYLNVTVSKDDKPKGIIIYFHTKEGKPFYAYKPLNLQQGNEIEQWETETLEKYTSEPFNYIYMKFIYWKLEVLSCVLVLRNRDWFKNNIGQLEKVWKIIEQERVTGYEHRAPVKRVKKEEGLKPFISKSTEDDGSICFLKVIKHGNPPENPPENA